MRIHGTVSAQRHDELEAAVGQLRSLDRVLRWAFAAGLDLGDVHAMDEFTQDLLVVLPDGLVLAFDST